jgi:hypothetical protein
MKTDYKMMVKKTSSFRMSPIEQSNRDVTYRAKYRRRYLSSKVTETLRYLSSYVKYQSRSPAQQKMSSLYIQKDQGHEDSL